MVSKRRASQIFFILSFPVSNVFICLTIFKVLKESPKLDLYRTQEKIFKPLTKDQLKDLALNAKSDDVRGQMLELVKDDQKLIEHIAVNDTSEDVRHTAIELIENPEVLKTHIKSLPEHRQKELIGKLLKK